MMELIIETTGNAHCVYDETLDLTALGSVSIRRASHVEPNEQGQWIADLGPVGGPCLGPFATRSVALAAEVAWLEAHWLSQG